VARQRLSTFISMFVGVLVVIVVGAVVKYVGSHLGQASAKQSFEVEAREVRMPNGLLGVHFLDERRHVMEARPNVEEVGSSLEEITEWEGYPIRAIYHFSDDGLLLMITLNLKVQGSEETFNAVNARLTETYGALSPPTSKAPYTLYAERQAGRTKLWHGLMPPMAGKVIHQVVAYRTDK
jgi:hypothetical protein